MLERMVMKRFWVKVDKNGPYGCWTWTAYRDRAGYGRIGITENGKSKSKLAHRVSWKLVHGNISDSLTLDHLCRVRHCVNPSHLEAVTFRENILRGINPAAINARKTHCKKGHELTKESTYFMGNGRRVCRICDRARKPRKKK